MKFLFLLPHPLIPPDRGNKHHTLNLLRRITREHDCDVIGFEEPGAPNPSSWRALEAELRNLKVLGTFEQTSGRRLRIEQARCIAAGLPAIVAKYRNESLRQKLEQIHARYDLVCFDMFPLVEYRTACSSRPCVLIASDAYSLMLLRAATEVRSPKRLARVVGEALLQWHLERTRYPEFDAVTTVSRAAEDWLRRVAPRAHLATVEVPAGQELLAPSARAHPGDGPLMLLCWELVENDAVAASIVRFVERSWPEVHRRFPEAELVIWGRTPHPMLVRAVSRADKVRLIGFVDDWLQMLRTASVFLFPHRCTAGLHLKLLSAMAVGLPVVTAPESCGWFPAQHGENIFVCRRDAEFTEACVSLFESATIREKVGAAARAMIERELNSDVLGDKMLRVFEQARARHDTPAGSPGT